MNRILLFDIDGTLVDTGGAGRRAIERAMRDYLALENIALGFSFAGMTDRAILRMAIEAQGRGCAEEDIDELITRYVDYLHEEVLRAEYLVFPGVVELLDALSGVEGCALGLGTGNAEKGARVKLERGRLNPYFSFGGYGCASEDRAIILSQGASRGAALLGQEVEDCEIIVIGDTPRDVAAALAIGARSVAVATGGHSIEVLRACKPDLVVDDLIDPRVLDVLSRSSLWRSC